MCGWSQSTQHKFDSLPGSTCKALPFSILGLFKHRHTHWDSLSLFCSLLPHKTSHPFTGGVVEDLSCHVTEGKMLKVKGDPPSWAPPALRFPSLLASLSFSSIFPPSSSISRVIHKGQGDIFSLIKAGLFLIINQLSRPIGNQLINTLERAALASAALILLPPHYLNFTHLKDISF